MYLNALQITNFRKINDLSLQFNSGVNLLVGENDAGKSCILDAIRLVTGVYGNDYLRISEEDFYGNHLGRSTFLQISCDFRGLSEQQCASFLEWLSVDEDGFYLKLTLNAKRKDRGNSTFEVFYDIKAGESEESGAIGGEAKAKLKVTYLKPLRDAGYELAPRRGSRLSQILGAYDIFQQQPNIVHPLVETMNKANADITDYFDDKDGKVVSDTINHTYLKEISLNNNPLQSKFGIAANSLGRILEKLELIGYSGTSDTNIGLGSNNLLFIAAEMLLLNEDSGYDGLKLSLIEEIEAHIHPQAQINLIDFINKHCAKIGFQSIITTHSNSLASKINIANLIICKNGKAFPLAPTFTRLASSDYTFLGRFLDDTKSNLFFAQGLLIVEGDAENLILPSLAEKIDLPLHKYGISIVNVGSTALLRYSKIFQRNDAQTIGIKVSCITDRDIPPQAAKNFTYQVKRRGTDTLEDVPLLSINRKTEDDYDTVTLDSIIKAKEEKYRGGDVEVFLAKTWTLEYELATSVLSHLIHRAILIAIRTNNGEKLLAYSDYRNIRRQSDQDFDSWTSDAKTKEEIAVEIYAPLERKIVSKAVTAQIFARLLVSDKTDKQSIAGDPSLKYLVSAIKHAANV